MSSDGERRGKRKSRKSILVNREPLVPSIERIRDAARPTNAGAVNDDDEALERLADVGRAPESAPLLVPPSVHPVNVVLWEASTATTQYLTDAQAALFQPTNLLDKVVETPLATKRKTLLYDKSRRPPLESQTDDDEEEKTTAVTRKMPKLVFANERTLTQWLNNSFLISVGSVPLILNERAEAKVVGTIMVFVSLVCVLYAHWQFRRRLKAIHDENTFFNFEAVWGPTMFASAFIVSSALTLLMAWRLRVNPNCNTLVNGTSVDVWGGTIQQRGLELSVHFASLRGNDLCSGMIATGDFYVKK